MMVKAKNNKIFLFIYLFMKLTLILLIIIVTVEKVLSTLNFIKSNL